MSLNRILIPIFVLLTIANFSMCQNERGRLQMKTSLFGENCNKTQLCKSRSGLVCDTDDGNVCRCARPDETVYESAREKCVALIGKKCILQNNLEYGGLERVGCVSQGECDSSTRLCKCPSGHYPDPDGTACHITKTYKSPCENSFECGESFSCNNGTCSCNSETEVYNEESFDSYFTNYGGRSVPSNRCIRKVGEFCKYESSASSAYCVRNAICSGETCTCSNGYSRTFSNLCGIGHGARCTDHLSSTCSDALRCSDGVCTCPNPDFETYDSNVQLCRTNIGEQCDQNKPFSCVQGAICVYDQDQDDFHCNCEDGSVEANAKTCQKEFRQPCLYSSAPGSPASCDSIADLVCKMGNCQCKNVADIYEPERRQCSTPVGSYCIFHTNCVSNSHCKKIFSTDRRDIMGRCKCLDGFEKIQNRTCVKLSTTLPILSTTLQPDIKVGKDDIKVAPTSQENLKDEPTLQ